VRLEQTSFEVFFSEFVFFVQEPVIQSISSWNSRPTKDLELSQYTNLVEPNNEWLCNLQILLPLEKIYASESNLLFDLLFWNVLEVLPLNDLLHLREKLSSLKRLMEILEISSKKLDEVAARQEARMNLSILHHQIKWILNDLLEVS